MTAFKPIDYIEARWTPVEGDGLEHFTIRAMATGYRVASVVIGEAEGRKFGLAYDVDIDSQWRVKSFALRAADGRTLAAKSPQPGRWQNADGKALDAFEGAIDLDLAFTPFTNTLVVRRNTFTKGQSRDFTMFYVPADTLEPFTDGQRYTCIEPNRRFHYEATDGTFSADIAFDEYGLVADYPGLYRRIA
jgi:uncharacterized protein